MPVEMPDKAANKRRVRYVLLAIALVFSAGYLIFDRSRSVEMARASNRATAAPAGTIRVNASAEKNIASPPTASDPELVLTHSVTGTPMFKVKFNDGVSEELYILEDPPSVRNGRFSPRDRDLLALTKEEIVTIDQLAKDALADLKIRQLMTGKIEWVNADRFTFEAKLSSEQAIEFERTVLTELGRLLGEDRKILFLEGSDSGRSFVRELEFFGRLVTRYTFELNYPGAVDPGERVVTLSREVGGADPRTGVPLGYRSKGSFLEKDFAAVFPGLWPAAVAQRPR